jgi:hypothetical protein
VSLTLDTSTVIHAQNRVEEKNHEYSKPQAHHESCYKNMCVVQKRNIYSDPTVETPYKPLWLQADALKWHYIQVLINKYRTNLNRLLNFSDRTRNNGVYKPKNRTPNNFG